MGIPVCIPAVPKKAQEYVASVIEKNWVSSLCLDEELNFIKKLEEGFSSFVGVKHGIVTTNGSTALDLAVATLGIGKGDEVIMPTFTIIATANSIIHNGATPVFVDVDPHTWCMNVDLIEGAITERTKAIMPVHIYGYAAEMDTIMEIAKKHNLFVIEDSAEAIGTEYKGKMAGSIGDIGCFSFYANKMMTSGEGGMLVTNNDEIAQKAALLKDHAFGEPRFIHHAIGFNFKMNNLTAAYAYASFEELPEYIEKRGKNAAHYNQLLSGTEGIVMPPRSDENIKNSYWMYGILIDEEKYGRSKKETVELLKSDFGIETRDFFYPMHKQPILIKEGYTTEGTSMPASEKLWAQGFYLPSSTNLKEEQIEYIADSLKKLKRIKS